MKLFDLHCDTLVECLRTGQSLWKNSCQLDVSRGLRYSPWIQCFAVWISDEARGAEATGIFDRAFSLLQRELQSRPEMKLVTSGKDLQAVKPGQCGVLLTVESGAAAAGSLEQLRRLYRCGVRMMTLTWNGENEIGGGILSARPSGLTAFGKAAVAEMERLSMVIDLSHASERLFYSVAEVASGPLAASHSNARAVCGHPRNLTDEQFRLICDRGGIVGLNLAPEFLSSGKAVGEDVLRHAEHFLSLGGESALAIGSDFDGTSLPEGICGIESMEELAEIFLRHNYPEALVMQIFFENAYKFFQFL